MKKIRFININWRVLKMSYKAMNRLYDILEDKEVKKMFKEYSFNSIDSKDLSKNDKKVFKAILKNEFNQK